MLISKMTIIFERQCQAHAIFDVLKKHQCLKFVGKIPQHSSVKKKCLSTQQSRILSQCGQFFHSAQTTPLGCSAKLFFFFLEWLNDMSFIYIGYIPGRIRIFEIYLSPPLLIDSHKWGQSIIFFCKLGKVGLFSVKALSWRLY